MKISQDIISHDIISSDKISNDKISPNKRITASKKENVFAFLNVSFAMPQMLKKRWKFLKAF